jgi:ATP-binding cassette subfamily B protein
MENTNTGNTSNTGKAVSAIQPLKSPGLFSVLLPYKWLVAGIVVLALLSNGLNLILPKLIANSIDAYTQGTLNLSRVAWEFAAIAFGIFLFAYLQSIAQTYASERAARDMRNDLVDKISHQNYSYIQEMGASRLLTNLTSDMDNVKLFISTAVVSIISSIFLIIGVATILIVINWKLGLTVMLILPLIAVTFFFVFTRLRPLFTKTQEVIDRLNRTINESVLGSALIRVLNSQQSEYEKFLVNNTDAKDLGMKQLRLFAGLIPIITFIANLAIIAILLLGGHYIILGTLSIGNFTAFMTYLSIVFFPIIIIGFMSNVISSASASHERVRKVLDKPDIAELGTVRQKMHGEIEVSHVSLALDGRPVLKDISFRVKAGSRTAIIGPTAAGKTQLLYLITGLLEPASGKILYDGLPLAEYEKNSFHEQAGLVFQDSIIFNMSLRENIAFAKSVATATDASRAAEVNLQKSIDAAELDDFIGSLPRGLDTQVSERGTSLSGGQKQRIMLARALALDPKVLLLDDFTARVDTATEEKILANMARLYPNITLVSVTQKISSIEHFDQIVLLMEGEVLAVGKHSELMKSSPEYVQIYNSQHSTTEYEEGAVKK